MKERITKLSGNPDMAKQLFELGAEPGSNTPEAFARYIATNVKKCTRVIAATGVKME